MITWCQLREKFFDKGYFWEFHTFIGSIPNPDVSRIIMRGEDSLRNVFEEFHSLWEETCQEEWEYWNTWIDYQKHK